MKSLFQLHPQRTQTYMNSRSDTELIEVASWLLTNSTNQSHPLAPRSHSRLRESLRTFQWSIKVQAYNILPFVFGIPAVLINVVTVLAILRIPRPISPNIRLLLSLAIADLLLAIVIVSDEIMSLHFQGLHTDSYLTMADCGFLFVTVLRHTAHIVISLNLTLLALDLYVAIVHPLGYRVNVLYEVRIGYALVVIWVLAIAVGFTQAYLPIVPWCDNAHRLNYCSSHWTCNKLLSEWFTLAFLLVCAVPMTVAYAIIIFKAQSFLRHSSSMPFSREASSSTDVSSSDPSTHIPHWRRCWSFFGLCCCCCCSSHPPSAANSSLSQENHSQIRPLHSATNGGGPTGLFIHVNTSYSAQKRRFLRKVRCLVTTLTIIGVFLLCFVPSDIAQLYLLINLSIDSSPQSMITATHVSRYLANLMLLNSLLDPLIYSWRLNDVRTGYRRLFACCYKRRQQKKFPVFMMPLHRQKSFSCSHLDHIRSSHQRSRLASNFHRLTHETHNKVLEEVTLPTTSATPCNPTARKDLHLLFFENNRRIATPLATTLESGLLVRSHSEPLLLLLPRSNADSQRPTMHAVLDSRPLLASAMPAPRRRSKFSRSNHSNTPGHHHRPTKSIGFRTTPLYVHL